MSPCIAWQKDVKEIPYGQMSASLLSLPQPPLARLSSSLCASLLCTGRAALPYRLRLQAIILYRLFIYAAPEKPPTANTHIQRPHTHTHIHRPHIRTRTLHIHAHTHIHTLSFARSLFMQHAFKIK